MLEMDDSITAANPTPPPPRPVTGRGEDLGVTLPGNKLPGYDHTIPFGDFRKPCHARKDIAGNANCAFEIGELTSLIECSTRA